MDRLSAHRHPARRRASVGRAAGAGERCGSGRAGGGPGGAAAGNVGARVVVVCNRRSAISRAGGGRLPAPPRGARSGRGLLRRCGATSDDETIGYADYLSAIKAPLRAYLAGHPGIDYIVLTKGVPIRVRDAPRGVFHGLLALDSVLAALDYDHDAQAREVDITDKAFGPTFHGHAWANRFWNSTAPFTHARCGHWLVTRLDGYTAADAISLTTRALTAGAQAAKGPPATGPILLDVCPRPALPATPPLCRWRCTCGEPGGRW